MSCKLTHIKLTKPLFDVVFSLILFITFLQLMLVTTLLLILTKHSNPFFIKLLPDKNAKIFRRIKFKTMTDEFDANGKVSWYKFIIIVENIDRILSLGVQSYGFKKIA